MTENTVDEKVLGAMQAISSLGEEDVPRISEDLFVGRYLPVLAGKVDSEKTPLLFWLEVAGSPYAPVDVMKGNEVLFRVPPLLKAGVTTLNARPGQGLDDVMLTAERKGMVHPKMGINYLDQELSRRQTAPLSATQEQERWRAILVRYGYVDQQADRPVEESEEDKRAGFTGEYDEL